MKHTKFFKTFFLLFVMLFNSLLMVAQSEVTDLIVNRQSELSANVTVMPPQGQGVSRTQLKKRRKFNLRYTINYSTWYNCSLTISWRKTILFFN